MRVKDMVLGSEERERLRAGRFYHQPLSCRCTHCAGPWLRSLATLHPSLVLSVKDT